MEKTIKRGLIVFIGIYFCLIADILFAANYPLEIIQPQEGLDTTNRYYKAYPGLEYKVPVCAIGGAYPFTYSLTTNPSGMTIDRSTGIITWSNPTPEGSAHNVTVQITDYEGNTDSHSWTITVTTTGFIFVDDDATGAEDGSIENPFSSLVDIYTGSDYADRSDTTYAGQFIYFRAGTYDPEGYFEGSGQQYQLEWPGTNKPVVWLEYPGETAVIDHDRAASGAFFDMSGVGNATDLFIQGIKFQDMLNHSVRAIGDRMVFFDCEFYNLGPGADGANSSFIMTASTGGSQYHDYVAIVDNNFDTVNIGSYIKTYYNNKTLIADNTLSNGSGTPIEGIAIKSNTNYSDVRGNFIDGINVHAIGGNFADCDENEIRFNRVLNASDDYNTTSHGGLTLNYHNTAGRHYIYRNTFEGTVTVRFATSDDGPFYFSGNVIINRNSGTPAGSHITYYKVCDCSRIIVVTPPGNLVGYPNDNIIDPSGNLTNAYIQYLGIYGDSLGDVPFPPTNVRIQQGC